MNRTERRSIQRLQGAAKANYGGFGPLNLAKASKYKAEAWKFLEWLTIKGGAADYLKANGFFSGFDDVNKKMYPAGTDPDVLTAAAQISYAFVWPPSPHVNAVNTELYLMLEKIFNRTQDVSTAYAEAQRRVQQITSE
jgi:ABC-type glycerol-3-phosphate transport system substrate-binding protein